MILGSLLVAVLRRWILVMEDTIGWTRTRLFGPGWPVWKDE